MDSSASGSGDAASEGAVLCDVARTGQDVADCWRLTYAAYLRQGLIEANPFGFHTAKEAIQANAAIILGRVNGKAVGTATAIVDGPARLPLDAVFHDELQALRRKGRRLLEIGLVAGHRTDALLEVLRYTIQFGRYAGCTDVLCGMHPRRERLYQRLFAMEPVGCVSTYPAIRNHPVRLMHGVYEIALGSTGKARLAPSLGRPVEASVFEERFRFDRQSLHSGPLAEFIQYVLLSIPDTAHGATE